MPGLILAAGHFAMLVLLAAAAFLFRGWCRSRIGRESGAGHGEGKQAQEILGLHNSNPLKCWNESDALDARRRGRRFDH